MANATESELAPAEPDLGRKLRLRRKIKNLSLQELSEQSKVSVGLISQIERGISAPSLRTLKQLCSALQMPLTWLFEADDQTEANNPVVRSNKRRHLTFEHLKMRKQLMTPDDSPELQMMLIVMEPGGNSGPEIISRPGAKCATVLEGQLKLKVDDVEYSLEAGDSFSFNAVRPHRYWCDSDRPVHLLWVVTPAMY